MLTHRSIMRVLRFEEQYCERPPLNIPTKNVTDEDLEKMPQDTTALYTSTTNKTPYFKHASVGERNSLQKEGYKIIAVFSRKRKSGLATKVG